MNITKKFWVLLMALFLAPLPLFSDSEWKVKKDSNGIMVETRKADGYAIEEFKATTTIDIPFEKAVAILKDVPKYTLWMYRLLIAEIVDVKSPASKVMYMKIDLPIPVKDRDMYLAMTEKVDMKNGVYESNNTGIDGYKETDCIRMKKVSFSWILKRSAADKNKTEVLYTSKGDPAGKLPAWLCTLGNVDNPYKCLYNLKYKYIKN